MSKYKVESGVELPDGRGDFVHIPFAEMCVGDSVYVERPEKRSPASHTSGVRAAMKSWRHKNGHRDREFTQRSDDNGLRIWRIK